MRGLFVLLGLVFTAIVAECNDMVYMYKVEFGNIWLFLVSAILGSFCIIKLSNGIQSPFMVWIGRMTMPLYVLQFHINQYSRATVHVLLDRIDCYNDNIRISMTILGSLIFCMTITYLISKNKYASFLFGAK